MLEAILAKILGSKIVLVAGGATGGLLVRVLWPHLRRLIAAKTTGAVSVAIKGLLDKEMADPILKDLVRKATLANVELVEYLTPDRGKGAEKKEVVKAALRKVFPELAVDIIADVIEEAVYSSDEVLKGTIPKP